MSYAKMMKWNKTHRKGINYQRGYMGFNPSGITAEEIEERQRKFIAEWEAKTAAERNEYRKNVLEITKLRNGSWEWEWCTFERAFGLHKMETPAATKTRILYRHQPGSPWLSYGIFPAAAAARVAANLRNQATQRGENIETDLQPENTPVQPQQPKDTSRAVFTGTLF